MDDIQMFKVSAGYGREKEENIYYVLASTKAKARSKFKKFISWLDISTIEQCTKEEYDQVVNNQSKYHLI